MALKKYLILISIFLILRGCYWLIVSFAMKRYVKAKRLAGDERSFLLILNDAYRVKPAFLLRFNLDGKIYLFFRRLFAVLLVLIGALTIVFVSTAQMNKFGFVLLNNI